MKRILIVFLLPFAFSACEKTVSDPEWPEHHELLVVKSAVTITPTDSVRVECYVRRTLPLWEEYTELKANVPTASVKISYDDTNFSVPIISPSSARYGTAFDDGMAQSYTLEVMNDAKHTSATIAIEPLNTNLSSILVYKDGSRHEINASLYADPALRASYQVRLRYKTVNETVWNYRSSSPYVPDRWYNYSLYLKGTDSLIFRTDLYNHSGEDVEVEIAVDAFSRHYTEYELAQSSYYNGDEFFGSSDTNPPFNFTGDGIGFFWYKREGDWHRLVIEK